jgi:hypothetical protein
MGFLMDCAATSQTWPYGPQTTDDSSAVAVDVAKPCNGCNRITVNKYLKDDKCPVCRNEIPGLDP